MIADVQVTLGLNEGTTPMMSFNASSNGTICRCEDSPLMYQDMCYLHTYDTIADIARGCIEIVLVFWSLIYLGIATKETTFNERRIYIQSMKLCPSRVLFLLACILMQFTVPLRLTCRATEENSLAILIMYLIPMYCLFFCRGFKTTGPFVTMIYRMIANDLLRFALIYLIFVLGFSQSYFVIFKSFTDGPFDRPRLKTRIKDPMKTPMDSILENFQFHWKISSGIEVNIFEPTFKIPYVSQ